MLTGMCKATTVPEAINEVHALSSLGHDLWTYAYMRISVLNKQMFFVFLLHKKGRKTCGTRSHVGLSGSGKLYDRSPDLYYATIAAEPAKLLPAVYTPTVGEACQKFGKMPLYRRGCYLCISDRGHFKEVLREYAESELEKDEKGNYLCDCIVFSDGGRILGLGDLGTWGMGIPIGKLDLYTVCAGFDPSKTIPLIIDAGCSGPEGNTDRLVIRDSPQYTGMRQARTTHKSAQGTLVNSAYYGENNVIEEFMKAATELFGQRCLLQFEDFNSNDAFPLLAECRGKDYWLRGLDLGLGMEGFFHFFDSCFQGWGRPAPWCRGPLPSSLSRIVHGHPKNLLVNPNAIMRGVKKRGGKGDKGPRRAPVGQVPGEVPDLQ